MNTDLSFTLRVLRNAAILGLGQFATLWITLDIQPAIKPTVIFMLLYAVGELSVYFKLTKPKIQSIPIQTRKKVAKAASLPPTMVFGW